MAKKDKPTYYDALEDALLNEWRMLIRADKPTYFEDCTDVLKFLTKDHGLNVILVSFDDKTPDLIDLLKRNKIDLSKIKLLDSVMICLVPDNYYGQTKVTIRRPGSFSDLQVTTYLMLKQLDFRDTCVVFVSLDKLDAYQNQNEIAIFLQLFGKQMEDFGIPTILMVHPVMDITLLIQFTRYVNKVIPFRKTPIVKG